MSPSGTLTPPLLSRWQTGYSRIRANQAVTQFLTGMCLESPQTTGHWVLSSTFHIYDRDPAGLGPKTTLDGFLITRASLGLLGSRLGASGWCSVNALWVAISKPLGIFKPDGCANFVHHAGQGSTRKESALALRSIGSRCGPTVPGYVAGIRLAK